MEPILRVRPGIPNPLGAVWDGAGVNFAVYSEHASSVTLCLFDADGEETRVPIRHRTDFVWHVYVESLGPGQRYAYRVDGPWEPERGLRFNPCTVLLDPYARALSGTEDWARGAFSYDVHHPEADLARASTEGRAAPLGIIVDPSFDWGADAPPATPLRKTVIYEAHVKGLTMRHPEVPPELRGTYLGMASEPVRRHLRELGVTAVEVMPVQGFVDPAPLRERGLRNHWGYGSIAFFAPDVRYRAGDVISGEIRQWKRMVKALHADGIEVILDASYAHTGEGNHLGPTFSLRGIDNPTYYRLVDRQPRYYFDTTGSGNTLNVSHPQALKLITDSLRHWVQEMHVDGFRFDLAAALARGLFEVDRLSTFFSVIHQDPVLARVKLIAEPWDLGQGGYQVARFPASWAEWNARYRDTVRAFWRGDGCKPADLGFRLTGSPDLYQSGGRSPASSINFVTAHDGFTLRDLVSYERKHNEANGERNRDGTDENRSWNCGVEGETEDSGVRAVRARQVRNLLGTLLLSEGTPMLCAGDEMGHTQGGNNDAYCQDNETTWIDWERGGADRALFAFVQRLVALRREHPLLQRDAFFRGREIRGGAAPDRAWFRPDGQELSDGEWTAPGTTAFAMLTSGAGLEMVDESGARLEDDDLLFLLNAGGDDVDFVIGAHGKSRRADPWSVLVDTADDGAREAVDPGQRTKVRAHSLKLLSRRASGPGARVARGIPASTYRLQLHEKFGFRDAAAIVDYLDQLGVGGAYLSPILRAQRGSTHGYDVVDHSVLNPELGSPPDFVALADAFAARGVQRLVDIVPNHVGIGSGENPWWTDVLENGPSSTYADFFDVEWQSPERVLRGKLLLPVLGRQFGQEVDDGKIGVVRDGGALWITYYDRRFPVSPRSYAAALERAARILAAPDDDVGRLELESIAAAIRHLPDASTTDAFERRGRAREKEVIKRRLAALCEAHPDVARAIDDAARAIASSPERLERFLGDQNYRLSYWRVATDEINYRRFFDVNELAAIRMEDPAVFAAAHRLILELVAAGRITGLRLDHTDGLYDPRAYFEALQQGVRATIPAESRADSAPLYVVAEKILRVGEDLPRSWAISGTTGYDYLTAINTLWVDPAAEKALTETYARFADGDADYAAVEHQAKLDVMDRMFSGEIHVLGHALKRIAESSRHARDFTLASLVRAIQEVVAGLDVYRTYVRPDGSRESSDASRIATAVARARRHNPMMEASIFEFLKEVLLLENRSDAAVRFSMRFQQLTGPIMAKGVEDTALYRYHRLVCLNEVGSDPSRFGSTPADFHAHNAGIAARWPSSMTTTTTHDTKRSEDVRARIAVLSEVPDAWAAFVARSEELLRGLVQTVDGDAAPSASDRYLFLQVAVGAFPFDGLVAGDAGSRGADEPRSRGADEPRSRGADEPRKSLAERLGAYMEKAVHEAKTRSSWTHPNEGYDRAVGSFVEGAMTTSAWLSALAEFVSTLAPYGATNGLAQLALRLGSPGVPDIYQGCEMWDLSLVDPDNRRPVDYGRRRAALADLAGRGAPTVELARDLVRTFADGRIKLHLVRTALALRRRMPTLFLEGAYEPLEGDEHLVAFERAGAGGRVVCVAPRLTRKLTRGATPWALGEVWGDRRLTLARGGRFVNAFTGDRLEGTSWSVGRVLSDFPVAWLVASDG